MFVVKTGKIYLELDVEYFYGIKQHDAAEFSACL